MNGLFEFSYASKGSAAYSAFGDLREESFHHVEPRSPRRREVNVLMLG